MSTTYGEVKTVDGKTVAVDASQISERVKLIIDHDEVGALRFGSAADIRRLRSLLNLAIAHVWGPDETD